MINRNELLTYALRGYEHRRDQINEAIARLRERIQPAQNNGGAAAAIATAADVSGGIRMPGRGAPRKRRKLSAAGRAAIIAATRKRWAAFHKAQGAAKPRRGKAW